LGAMRRRCSRLDVAHQKSVAQHLPPRQSREKQALGAVLDESASPAEQCDFLARRSAYGLQTVMRLFGIDPLDTQVVMPLCETLQRRSQVGRTSTEMQQPYRPEMILTQRLA